MASSTMARASGIIFTFRKNERIFPYASCIISNSGYLFSFVLRSIIEPAVGTTVSATIKDAASAYEMVIANGTISCATIPVVNIIGRNTHTVVSVDEIIGPATCAAPCTADLGAEMP